MTASEPVAAAKASDAVAAIALLATLALAACAGDRLPWGGAPDSSGRGSGARAAPPVDMAGRWTLSAPGAGACAMNFAGAAGASEGTIAPEGGCPGNFFTSRKWTFEQGALVIKNHNSESLAQLSFAANRFDGQSTAGQPVTLAR